MEFGRTAAQQSATALAMSAGGLGGISALACVASASPANSVSDLSKASVDLLARHEQLLNGIDADLQVLPGFLVELDLDHFLGPAGADHDRHADVEAIEAVLALDIDGAGHDALLVAEI